MNSKAMTAFKEMLILDEGLKLKPYKDSLGVLTIGVGRNLESRGLSRDEAMILLHNDIEAVLEDAGKFFPWIEALDLPRQFAFLNMLFQLGAPRLSRFYGMIDALQKRDWERASAEALDSLWAKQTPNRAKKVAEIFRTGSL